jgi:hypothetical protein
VIAIIEPADDEQLDNRPGGRCRRKAGHEPEPKRASGRRDSRTGEGAEHIERAVRQIDHAHDAEDQRQPGRHQEQHDAELQAVQDLLNQKGGLHRLTALQRWRRH